MRSPKTSQNARKDSTAVVPEDSALKSDMPAGVWAGGFAVSTVARAHTRAQPRGDTQRPLAVG